jgi:hypothetical protein
LAGFVIFFAAVEMILPDIKLVHPEGSNNNTPKNSSIVEGDVDVIFLNDDDDDDDDNAGSLFLLSCCLSGYTTIFIVGLPVV